MRFFTTSEIRPASRDSVFRPRPIHALGGFVFFVGLALGALSWPWLSVVFGRGEDIPTWLSTVVGIFLLLFVSIAWRSVRGTLRSDGWLVVSAFDGIYVRFRSHLNFSLPASDPVVAFIPRSEVVSVRARRVKMKRMAEVDNETAKLGGEKFLEISVRDAEDLEDLEQAIATERKKRGDGQGGGGSVALHYPVRVLPGGVIELDWAGIRPGLSKSLKLLGKSYSLLPKEVSRAPMLADLELGEREEALALLVRNGQEIRAIKLARKFYGYNITEAKAFLNDLPK